MVMNCYCKIIDLTLKKKWVNKLFKDWISQ